MFAGGSMSQGSPAGRRLQATSKDKASRREQDSKTLPRPTPPQCVNEVVSWRMDYLQRALWVESAGVPRPSISLEGTSLVRSDEGGDDDAR